VAAIKLQSPLSLLPPLACANDAHDRAQSKAQPVPFTVQVSGNKRRRLERRTSPEHCDGESFTILKEAVLVSAPVPAEAPESIAI